MKKQSKNIAKIVVNFPKIKPKTKNQGEAWKAWEDGDNLVLAGSAGTGKTFLAMYLGLDHVISQKSKKLYIVRSAVPTRDMGYLPGTLAEKIEPFEAPYKSICLELFDNDTAIYNKLINSNQLEFITTSFIRGTQINDAVVVIDEMQNLNFHELDSVITRIGRNCRVIFSGDYYQSDFKDGYERDGIQRFLRIVERLKHFSVITFDWDDIVRSDFLRDYIMTKEMLGIK